MDVASELLGNFYWNMRATTSPGRHGGSKEDKDEQSSLVGCGLKTHDFDPNEVWKDKLNDTH